MREETMNGIRLETEQETGTVADADGSAAFDDTINRLGRYTSIVALLGMFAVPVVMSVMYGIDVNFAEVVEVGGSLIAMFAPMAIVENISYYAIIGAGGVYLSCITGNIMNMKLPCALSGMKIADVEPGSRQGDIISILSIGVSSLVTTLILVLGMFVIGEFLLPYLSHPVLKPGFDNIMPALMGAIAVPFVLKNGKVSVAPILVAFALCMIMGPLAVQRKQSYLLPVVMGLSVLAAYAMHKKGLFGTKSKQEERHDG